MYRLTSGGAVRLSDGAHIPADPKNRDYAEYLAWVGGGGDPEPAAPPPVVYTGAAGIDARLRTTTAAATELYRATLAKLTLYRARLELLAVDAGNGNARYIDARVVAKRLANGALLVGTPGVVANLQDAGASTWAISATVDGNDFVVTVAGQAGRNIDWHLHGEVVSFTPGGRS